MISQERIDEFKAIFKRKYGVEYTDAEAREAAENLIRFFEILMQMDQEKKTNEKAKKTEG